MSTKTPCDKCGIEFGVGDWPLCEGGHGRAGRFFRGDVAVHSSERAHVYMNPGTGEHRTPPRADMPMAEVYRRQGYERVEIQNMGKFERQAGVIHEASNWGRNGRAESELMKGPAPKETPKAVIESLVNELRK